MSGQISERWIGIGIALVWVMNRERITWITRVTKDN